MSLLGRLWVNHLALVNEALYDDTIIMSIQNCHELCPHVFGTKSFGTIF